MARSVADLRLAVDAMSVCDIRDPWSVAVNESTAEPARPLSVAVLTADGSVDCDPAVLAALDRAAGWLGDTGYQVEHVTPPHMAEASNLFWSLMLTEEGMMADKDGASSANSIDELGDEAVIKARHSTMANATLLDHGAFIRALARRTAILRDWLQFLERYPIVLMPVSWKLPFPIDYDQQGDAALGELVRAHEPLTAISLLGLPGLSVPTGTENGVPMGVQIVANRFREELCLSVGEVIEAHCPMGTPIDPIG
jgi:amidase